jgi:hypothetical protein
MENTVSIVDDVTAYAEVFTELFLRNGLHNPVSHRYSARTT